MTCKNELERARLEQIAEVLCRLIDFGPAQLRVLEAAVGEGISQSEEVESAVHYVSQLAEELGDACAEFGKPTPTPMLRIVE